MSDYTVKSSWIPVSNYKGHEAISNAPEPMKEMLTMEEWFEWLESNPHNIGSQSGNVALLMKVRNGHVYTKRQGTNTWMQKQSVYKWRNVRKSNIDAWDYWKVAHGLPMDVEDIINAI